MSTSSRIRTISAPRRLLILAPDVDARAVIPSLLLRLTGTPVAPSECEGGVIDNHQPSDCGTSFAGYVSHPPLRLRTKYYSADVPIWVDELPLERALKQSPASAPGRDAARSRRADDTDANASATLEEWKGQFLSDEAREVRDVIGAVVLCAPQSVGCGAPSPAVPTNAIPGDAVREQQRYERVYKSAIEAVAEVRTRIEEERSESDAEVPGILIVMQGGRAKTAVSSARSGGLTEPSTAGSEGMDGDSHASTAATPFSFEWWDEELAQLGLFDLEVIGWNPETQTSGPPRMNEYGELTGLDRALQVLETLQWSAPSAKPSGKDGTDDEGDNSSDGDGDADQQCDARGNHRDSIELDMAGLDREIAALHMSLVSEHQEEERPRRDVNGVDGEAVAESAQADEELQVAQFERTIQRVLSLREANLADMPYEERKRLARQAVEDIMKTI
ncbi:hypothetical protein KEM52_005760 [Ascosphaera acerosa]|nr:hypothetical protein KEM52_005760 [Ascosphaera acerosa]